MSCIRQEMMLRNYHSLKAEFFDGKKASKGLNILNYLQENNDTAIKELLGSHLERGYYGEELKQRFYVDDLLSYYNLLFIGILAGFLPQKLDEETTKEISSILGHPSVFKYYSNYYPYKLCEFTSLFFKNELNLYQETNSTTIGIFNEFIALTRSVKTDQDIIVFLGMLDFVSYGNTKISDVIDTLKSFKKLNEVFTSKNDAYLKQAVWGFVKYTSFITQFSVLLKKSSSYSQLQSSMWYYHEYNFGQLNIKMKSFFDEAFTNLEKTMNDKQLFVEIIKELYGNEIPDEIDENELMKYTLDSIKESRKDVDNVLEMEYWIKPLSQLIMPKNLVRKTKIRRVIRRIKASTKNASNYKFKTGKASKAKKIRPRRPRNNEL